MVVSPSVITILRFSTSSVLMAVLLLSLTGCPSGESGPRTETHHGRLETGDAMLETGEYADEYFVDVEVGDAVIADVTSQAFDPFVWIEGPGQSPVENEDFRGSPSQARAELTATESGKFRVVVTSDESGSVGPYVLEISVIPAKYSEGTAASFVSDKPANMRTENGRLEEGDDVLASGEYNDIYTFEATAGQYVVIDLQSDDFDPYLILQPPSGDQSENDDYEGSASRSQIALKLEETGTYQIRATSYQPGETGRYTLSIIIDDQDLAESATQTINGSLANGDQKLPSGEYYDIHTIEGTPGQSLSVEVSSNSFDTYLIITGPNDFKVENDDLEDDQTRSKITTELAERGTYKILVTSYEKGEVGNYVLTISNRKVTVPTGSRDVRELTYGETVNGRLETSDGTLETGEFRDFFTFEGSAGDKVVIDLKSSVFDPFLILFLPDGRQIENDDHEGSTTLSQIFYELPATGRYRIGATSYSSGDTGAYTLSVSTALQFLSNPIIAGGSGGNVYGLFVGMGAYGGRMGDLDFTAEDADRVKNALQTGVGMPEANAIVLKDSRATVGAFRQAVTTLSSRIGPNDTFVLFYSGHGGRYDRATAVPSDPDAVDESIELYDAEILDDQLAEMLNPIRARTQLIVMDACFSGGFSKDLIAKPGRMGMFSSEEDVTSSVAGKFLAGGFLSQFFAEAVGEGRSDANGDGDISAIELSQYVYERYRGEVKSSTGGAGAFVTNRDLGYQKLVVDRGSIGPDQPVFKRRR